MFHEQMINFLEATVIFLLMTNAISVFAATYAVRIANDSAPTKSGMADQTPSRWRQRLGHP